MAFLEQREELEACPSRTQWRYPVLSLVAYQSRSPCMDQSKCPYEDVLELAQELEYHDLGKYFWFS